MGSAFYFNDPYLDVVGKIIYIRRTGRKIKKESGGKIIGNIGNHPRGRRETIDEKDKGKVIDIRRRKAQ